MLTLAIADAGIKARDKTARVVNRIVVQIIPVLERGKKDG